MTWTEKYSARIIVRVRVRVRAERSLALGLESCIKLQVLFFFFCFFCLDIAILVAYLRLCSSPTTLFSYESRFQCWL